jgi:mRNA-degrading endonuclease YafQ of YafQ-DinJ toxin-antitoxin module
MKLRLIAMSLVLASIVSAQDCGPKSLHALCGAWGIPTQENIWVELTKQDATGADLGTIVHAWKQAEPKYDLVVIYSMDNALKDEQMSPEWKTVMETLKKDIAPLKKEYDHKLVFNGKPYLWMGIRGGGWHMCMAYFNETDVKLVHPNTIDRNTGKPYEEFLGYKEFFGCTFVLFYPKVKSVIF